MSKPNSEKLIVMGVVMANCIPIVLFPQYRYAHNIGNTFYGGRHGHLFVGTALHAQQIDRQRREPGFDFNRDARHPYQGVIIGWIQVLFRVAFVVACGLAVLIVRRAAEQNSASVAFRAALVSTVVSSVVLASVVMLGGPAAARHEDSMPIHNPILGGSERNEYLTPLFWTMFAVGNGIAGVSGFVLGAPLGGTGVLLHRRRIPYGRLVPLAPDSHT